ncbi:glycosyltransferase, partial [bacterium]|nr:glycosyltransferase [bacterium]
MSDPLFEPFWSIALLISAVIYVALLEKIRRGLLRLTALDQQERSSQQPKVSVIIPCRDEAEHIGNTLDDLTKQDYPQDLLQIIVVNDRSTDGTGEIAKKFCDSFNELIVIDNDQCPENLSPKKYALSLGMQRAHGEILMTTDGDCRYRTGWVRSLVEGLADNVGVITGLTIFERGRPEPLWQRLQQMDYLSHSFFAAGAIGSGMAFNCNGSNLAYRRETFSEIGGYQQIKQVVTGDDTLLLQKIKQIGRWQI